MFGRNGKTLGDTWSEILIANERRDEDSKLTDEQLKQEILKHFPAHGSKSTVQRMSMIRSDYNAGRGLFKNHGAAGTRKRPRSFKYG